VEDFVVPENFTRDYQSVFHEESIGEETAAEEESGDDAIEISEDECDEDPIEIFDYLPSKYVEEYLDKLKKNLDKSQEPWIHPPDPLKMLNESPKVLDPYLFILPKLFIWDPCHYLPALTTPSCFCGSPLQKNGWSGKFRPVLDIDQM
jgi:hypothetical protein